jgi:AcrR family transcriptional regulator
MAVGSAKPKKQRRGTVTRKRLLDATKILLAEFDYQSLTLDRIAEEVGISKSSIIWHFGSKEVLLTEAVFDLFEEVDRKINLKKPTLSTLGERLEFLISTVADYFKANPWAKGVSIALLFNNQVPTEIHHRLKTQWNAHIREIQSFLSSGEVQVSEENAAVILAIMHGCYLQWCLNGCVDEPAEQMSAAVSLLDLESLSTLKET